MKKTSYKNILKENCKDFYFGFAYGFLSFLKNFSILLFIILMLTCIVFSIMSWFGAIAIPGISSMVGSWLYPVVLFGTLIIFFFYASWLEYIEGEDITYSSSTSNSSHWHYWWPD